MVLVNTTQFFCHVAIFVFILVTAAMGSDSNNDNIIRFVGLFNYDLLATDVPNLTPWQQDPNSLICSLVPECQGVKNHERYCIWNLVVVVQAFDPSTQEAEAGESLEIRGQPGLQEVFKFQDS